VTLANRYLTKCFSAALIAVTAALSCSAPASAQCFHATPGAELLAGDAAAGDELGVATAISGNTAVVGAWREDFGVRLDAGAAYVFVRGLQGWTQQAKLVASPRAGGDHFGAAVAISGDTIVVGAADDDNLGTDAGTVYVFTRSGTTWTQQAQLLASDGAAGDSFGIDVAIVGDTILVGASSRAVAGNQSAGSVYAFTRAGAVWSQAAIIPAPDPTQESSFGYNLSLSTLGTRQVASITSAGGVYMFTLNTVVPGSVWTQRTKLTEGLNSTYSYGNCARVSGNTVAVGAPGTTNEVHDPAYPGAVYVYVSDVTGGSWALQVILTASDATGEDYFGERVAIAGNTLVITSPFDDNSRGVDAGAGYVFTRSGATWTQRTKLIQSAGAASDGFGTGLGFDGDYAVIGSFDHDTAAGVNAGAAYPYAISNLDLTQQPLSAWTCPTGSWASFTAGAVGSGTLTYQWRRGTANLVNGGNVAGAATAVLTLSPVGVADASADYNCVISGTCGSLTTDSAALIVREGGYANCDASTSAPVLNVADFTCFLQKYAAQDPYANCDGSTTPPTLNVADFSCFLQKYAAGCP
jgi:hypothetical protein